jgi:hypothetical protein
MPLASLLTLPTNARGAAGFVFDHDQEHRSMVSTLQATTTRTNAAQPTLLDPAPIHLTAQRAGNWHYDHQTGHDQFSAAMFGFRIPQNMADATFADKLSLSWWTFVNHQEHYRINQIP